MSAGEKAERGAAGKGEEGREDKAVEVLGWKCGGDGRSDGDEMIVNA